MRSTWNLRKTGFIFCASLVAFVLSGGSASGDWKTAYLQSTQMADDDALMSLDVSDTSMAATGRQKYINFIDAIKIGHVRYPKASEADQASAGTGYSMKDIIDGFGTEGGVVYLRHTASAATTAYTISTTWDLSSKTNVFFYIEPGARICVGNGVTIALPSPDHVIAQPNQQIFELTGTGAVAFASSGGSEIYTGWYPATTAGIQAAFSAAGRNITVTASITLTDTITLYSNQNIKIAPGVALTQSGTNKNIFYGTSLSQITITGSPNAELVGKDETEQLTNRGLIRIEDSTDIKITDLEVRKGHDLIGAANCDRVFVERCDLHYFQSHGIIASKSTDFHIDHNHIYNCTQTGAANAYGVQATGDNNGGDEQIRCSISFNQFDDIKSWDAIMSHDVTGLDIIGNIGTDIRTGVDIGHSAATNVIKDVVISNNVFTGTSTDTYAAANAQNSGIAVVGYSEAAPVQNLVVSNNVLLGFNQHAQSTDCCLRVSNVDGGSVSGNQIIDTASNGATVEGGIYLSGFLRGVTVKGNTIRDGATKGFVWYSSKSVGVNVFGNSIIGTPAGAMTCAYYINSVSCINSKIDIGTVDIDGVDPDSWISIGGSLYASVYPSAVTWELSDSTKPAMIAPKGTIVNQLALRRHSYINMNYVYTEVRVAVSSGTTLELDDSTGMSTGDQIFVLQDNDRFHITTVASVTDGDTIELTDAVSSAIAIDQPIYVVRWARSVKTGSFTMDNANSKAVSETCIDSLLSRVILFPTSASASTLQAGTSALYVSARTHATSFTVSTADAGAAAGTETFYYVVYNGAD